MTSVISHARERLKSLLRMSVIFSNVLHKEREKLVEPCVVNRPTSYQAQRTSPDKVDAEALLGLLISKKTVLLGSSETVALFVFEGS